MAGGRAARGASRRPGRSRSRAPRRTTSSATCASRASGSTWCRSVTARRRARTPTPEPELRARLGLGAGPIVLNVGVKKVHKNQLRLVQALPRGPRGSARRTARPGGRAHPVRGRRCARRPTRLGLGDAVAFPGYVDDADLEGLYAPRRCSSFPSLNEGFGLPVLEAMARGVPVVTSDGLVAARGGRRCGAAGGPDIRRTRSPRPLRACSADSALRERLIAAGRLRPRGLQLAAQMPKAPLESWRRALADRAMSDLRGTATRATHWLGAVPGHPRVVPLTALLLRGRTVRASTAFVARELLRRRGAFAYRVRWRARSSRACATGRADPVTLGEVFHERDYAPPPQLHLDPRRIVDLGANVGLLRRVRTRAMAGAPRWSAYEPDPANAAVHARAIAINGWTSAGSSSGLRPSTRHGEVRFHASGDALSHVGDDGCAGRSREGRASGPSRASTCSRWTSRAVSGRFSATRASRPTPPRAVVLEYHPAGAPGPDPASRGHSSGSPRPGSPPAATIFRRDDGYGMLWAWRP